MLDQFAEAQSRDKNLLILLDQAKKSQRSSLDSGIYYSQRALRLAEKGNDNWGIAKSYALLANFEHLKKGPLKAAVSYIQSIDFLSQADTADYFLAYTVFKNLAVVQSDYGLYEESSQYYDSSSLALARHIKVHPDTAKKYGDHILLYRNSFFKAMSESQLGNLEEAREILEKLLEDNAVPKSIKTNALNRVGIIFLELKDFERSLSCFRTIYESPESSVKHRARALHNTASVYFQMENYELAKVYSERALDLNLKGKDKSALFFNFLDLGEIHLSLKNDDEALINFKEALDLNLSLDRDPRKFRIYRLLADASILGMPQMAKEYLRKYDEIESNYQGLRDSIILQNKRVAFQNTMGKYAELKESRIENIQAESTHKRRLLRVVISGLILIAVFVIYVLLSRRQTKEEKQKMIDEAVKIVKRPRRLKTS